MFIKDVCTTEELQELFDNSDSTIKDLAEFVETKTNQEYLFVEREYLKDLNKHFDNNLFYISKINQFINYHWIELITMNENITEKWRVNFEKSGGLKHKVC